MAKDELPRGQLLNIILSILTDTDKYGYEIIETIKDKTNGSLIVKQPSLYSCLRRMEEQNLISSYWRDSEIGGRRHYYSITDYGKKYAEKWQIDLTAYQSNEKDLEIKDKDNDSINETILQQTNLFSTNQNSEKIEQVSEKIEEQNKSYVQYDLFSSPTLISEPSDDVFDCIKKLRESAQIEENTNTMQEDKLIVLRQQNNDIQTDYEADNHNIKYKNVTENDVKKEFLELSKQRKSFANILKENPESIKDIETNQLIDDSNNITNSDDTLINESMNNEIESNIIEEKPTIFQSLAELNDDELDNDENESKGFEFIDLTNLDFDKQPTIDTENYNEDNNDNKQELIEPLEEEVVSKSEVIENVTYNNSYSLKYNRDDAVYITQKPSYEDFPKVKKIAPARFEQFAKYDSRIDEKVAEIYNKNQKKDVNPTPNESTQEIIEVQENINEYFQSDFDTLKAYYNNHNIKFGVYKKNNNKEQDVYINKNKLNMLSYLSIAAISIFISLIMFICCKNNQPSWNWLYIVLPTSIALFGIFFVFKYVTNKNAISPYSSYNNYNWIYKLILSIVGILVTFSINLICGLALENFANYITTFIYLSILICLIPISSLVDYILIKTKFVKIN